MNERIELTDTTMEILMKMSEGNPGAVSVLAKMLKEGGTVDPDGFMGGLGAILSLDTLGIRGHKIWMLWKDVSGQKLGIMLGLLRANQLGFLSKAGLLHAIENRGAGLDIPALLAQVKERLPAFQIDFV